MAKKSSRRRKVSFIATKRVAQPTKISFVTKAGKKVAFAAKKPVKRRVRVTFYKKAKSS